LLIAALANYLLFLTGLQARESGLERRYQSNSIKDRRVLSLCMRPAMSSTQLCEAKTWCALKSKCTPVLAF